MRYLPLDASEREAMLARIGVPDIEAFATSMPVRAATWVWNSNKT